MTPVKLCYPNEWGLHMREPEFNWFLFAKKVWNSQHKVYFLEVSMLARFYDESTGKTLKSTSKDLRVVITSQHLKPQSLKKLGVSGYVREVPGECKFPICGRRIFFFLPGSLEPVKTCHSCPIIKFARKNNSELRKRSPDFPTCEEISKMLTKNSCEKVCQILYNLIP